MDWRNRCYYLVKLNNNLFWWQKGHDDYGEIYTSSIPILKNNVPTIKFSEPYNHFVNSAEIYDGNIEGVGYVQMMISCNKEHEETLL